ncbi:MAG: GGDEF domain-containing protein [Chloroflexi bacterium]|nr:GGDEF domain-containing protein [Chloroflexota bacterium]
MLNFQNFYKELLDNLYDGVYFVDNERRITYWNKSAERLTGYSAEQVMGRSCKDNILNHCNGQGEELCLTGCPLSASMKNGALQEAEVFLHHANGHRVPVLVRVSPMLDENGQVIGAVEVFSDNLRNVQASRQINSLTQKVQSDKLTGLSNREFLEMQFQTAMFELDHQQVEHCLAFVDIDRFKQINDQYGHNVGDRALVMVADTLRAALRQTDIIARWGGDEFCVLLKNISAEETVRIAEQLRALIERCHIPSEGVEVRVTVSIGLTMLRVGDTLEAVIERADMRMLKSKNMGRNQVTSAG